MNSKAKGGSFERSVCKALSLWVTHGKKQDVFWRSAMSGGRATVRGIDVRQCGDVCSVAPEGHILTDRWLIECKHTKDLHLWHIIESSQSPSASIVRYWNDANTAAHRWGKSPILVAKQNQYPTLMCLPMNYKFGFKLPVARAIRLDMDIYLFDEVMKQKFKPF